MSKKFTRINIAFMPPTDVAKYVAKLSKEISEKEKTYFVIDNKNIYPHITIYPPEYPTYKIEEVLSKVEKLAKKLPRVKFKFEKIKNFDDYISVGMHYSKEIRNIHETIIEELNPLRDGHIKQDANNTNLLKEEKENIQKYGYPNLMDSYSPHITITRLGEEEIAEKIIKEIKWPIKEFTIKKLGAYKMGKNGTCTELIKEFKLL